MLFTAFIIDDAHTHTVFRMNLDFILNNTLLTENNLRNFIQWI